MSASNSYAVKSDTPISDAAELEALEHGAYGYVRASLCRWYERELFNRGLALEKAQITIADLKQGVANLEAVCDRLSPATLHSKTEEA